MFAVHGLTYDEMTVELDNFEQLFHSAALQVMRETAHHLGQVATAAAEPSQSGEPAASMDTLGLIATLWAAQVLGTPNMPDPPLIAALKRVYYQSVNRIRDALQRARHRATPVVPEAVPNVIPSDEVGQEFPDLLPDLPDIAENDSLLLPDDIAYDYLSHASNRMTRFSDEMWLSAREQLLQGFAEGESIDELRNRLVNVANLTEPRAVMVARTEVHQAAEAGSLAMVQYSEFTGTKSWLASEDARTRPTHVLADGQTVGLEEFFDVGGFPLLFPGDPDGPPQETIQCLPGNTVVQSIGSVQRVYRRWYEGTVITINTASGVQFSATPNHPVLTRGGWKTIQDVNLSDQLVNTSIGQRVTGSDPQIGDVPAKISEIYHAASEAGLADWIEGSRMDFHGDGSTGKIDIITIDSNLPGPTRKQFSDTVFFTPNTRQVSLFGSSDFESSQRISGDERNSRVSVLASNSVGGTSQPTSFDEVDTSHSLVHSRATSSDLDTRFSKPETDDVTRNAKAVGNTLLRLATNVSRDDLTNGEIDSPILWFSGSSAGIDPCLPQALPDSHSTASNILSYIGDRESFRVEFDHVVDIQVDAFCGHVYNLETESGTYIGNGITNANCRCTQTYNLDDEPLPLIASEREVTMAEPDNATEVLVADVSSVVMEDIPALAISGMDSETSVGWEAVLVVEGIPTGDGRQFADGSLTWAELPISLLWQKMTADGHSGSCIVGKIDEIERQGNQLIGRGTFDAAGEYGAEAFRLVQENFLKGVSVDVDSIDQSNIEYFYPEAQMQDELVAPDLVIFHSGRIRGATLCAIPAFVEAVIRVVSPEEVDPEMEMPADGYALTAAAVPGHTTATSDTSWDAAAQEKKLKTPMSLATAKAMYAWYDADKVDGGEIGITACKFPHHEVNADGTPGAANLKACSAGIAALHGARTPTTIPEADQRGVYNHLARHLKDGGMTPPDFAVEDVVTAAAYVLTIPDVPPAWWFDEPVDVDMHGALTVTDEGRVYGWVAPAGIAHRSFERRVEVPMGNVDYTKFMGREAIVEGGRIITGALTMDCGHASVANPDGAVALEHYDNSCSVFANVRIGEHAGKGVWVAGSVVPGVTANQIVRAMACQLSGDWRPHKDRNGWREFTGALLVPVPGFAMARAQASVRMDEGQLVASTVPVRYEETDHSCGCSVPAEESTPEVSAAATAEPEISFSAIAEFIAQSIGRTPGTRAEELRTLVHGPKE